MRIVPALGVLALTHALFFGDVLFGDRSLSPATYTSGLTPSGPYGAPPPSGPPHVLDVEGAAWVDEPSPYLAAPSWHALEPPLWNDAEGLGAPLAANLNSGAGNPLHLPLALWPGPLAADLFALARLLILGAGTAAYLGALTLTPVAAVTGAVLVAYGGYATAWIVHHPLSAELFLPYMLLGIERGRRGAARGWTLLALATAGSLVGGKLQATLLCVAVTGAYAAMRARRNTGGAGTVTCLSTGVAIGIGSALAGYLMLPAAELMARASGLTLGARSALAGWVLPGPTLAAVALPKLFVPPARVFADGLPLPPYVGVGATLLAVLAVCVRRSPLRDVARFFAAVAGLVLVRNEGWLGSEWMTAVPVLRGIFFLKYTFVAAFALAVLAAIGVDAVARGLVRRREAAAAVATTAVVLALLVAAGAHAGLVVGTMRVTAIAAAVAVAAVLLAPPGLRPTGTVAAAVLAAVVVAELRADAPSWHPPRVDPYRPPPYVEFLRGRPDARVVGDDGLMPPLTSGAAGLRDVRAIDVLTPGASYAFFLRLVSFCGRIIHFTADPDLPFAATAPAIDLAGVRWVVSRGPLALDDLDRRVDRQVGLERVGRLLAGLRGFRTRGAPLALGTIDVRGARRFAFSLETPFTLELDAESEAPEIAWDLHVGGAATRVTWEVAGASDDRGAIDVAADAGWRAVRVALGDAGTRRRTRLRVHGESDGTRARVDLGDLGFTEGEAAESARRSSATAAHRAERDALAPVFRDADTGTVVYENRNALPRAFRVARLEPVATTEAALTRLADGFDFRSAALVQASPAALAEVERRAAASTVPADASTAAGASAFAGATVVVKADPDALSIVTDGATTALVVVGDLDYPGWRAAIDGAPAAILRSDGVFRGVLVPPGPHCVELRYTPASLLWGGALTVLAAVVVAPFARRAGRVHGRDVLARRRMV